MRKKIIAGNWKMHGNLAQVTILVQQLLELASIQPITAECIILPPVIYLPVIANKLRDSNIQWGAQNVYPKNFGPYTGEISGQMLQDYSCRYVLVGHSERRQLFNETEKFIMEKFHHIKEHGMIPILCVGETFAEREQKLTEKVLATQLNVINETNTGCVNTIIAYEPRWAIGSGQAAQPEQVQSAHAFIRNFISNNNQNAQMVPILYGGSLHRYNAVALFAMPDVDGGLVGGASLDAQHFVDIMRCIN